MRNPDEELQGLVDFGKSTNCMITYRKIIYKIKVNAAFATHTLCTTGEHKLE